MSDEHLSIEEARTFRDPDGTYMAALNDPTVFEALCSDVATISLLIEVLTMKVEHLETQLKTRAKRHTLALHVATTELARIEIAANYAEWEGKVTALLRSTIFHLRQTLRRAHKLWDDPIRTLKEAQRLIQSDLDNADVLDAISELFDKTLEALAKQPDTELEGWQI